MFDFDFEDFLEFLTVIAFVLCLIGFDGCWVLFIKYFECNVFICLFTGSIVTLLNIAVVKLSIRLLKDLF